MKRRNHCPRPPNANMPVIASSGTESLVGNRFQMAERTTVVERHFNAVHFLNALHEHVSINRMNSVRTIGSI